jgi:hypothetical protein
MCYNAKELFRHRKFRRTHPIIPKVIYKICLHCHSKFQKTGRNQKYCHKCIPLVIRIRDYEEARTKQPFHYCKLCKKIKLWFPNRHKHCPQCQIKYEKLKRKQNYIRNHKSDKKKMSQWRKIYPYWSVLIDIRQRCNNPNCISYQYYGGRGIKNYLTKEDIKFLWFRDKAFKMKHPHIHRKNVDKNYTKFNCKFIEKIDHEIIHLKLRLKHKIIERNKIYE